MGAQTAPSPFRERAGVRGNMRLCCSFRSLHVSCVIFTIALVNVPGWLIRHHPGDPGSRQENRRVADYSPHPWGSPLRGQRERSSKLLQTILSSSYSFRLSGRAPALAARPCASTRPYGNASAVFSRTRSSLLCLHLPVPVSCCKKNGALHSCFIR